MWTVESTATVRRPLCGRRPRREPGWGDTRHRPTSLSLGSPLYDTACTIGDSTLLTRVLYRVKENEITRLVARGPRTARATPTGRRGPAARERPPGGAGWG